MFLTRTWKKTDVTMDVAEAVGVPAKVLVEGIALPDVQVHVLVVVKLPVQMDVMLVQAISGRILL